MENSLQEDNFWWFLNNSTQESPSRISYLFDLLFHIALEEEEDREMLEKITGDGQRRDVPVLQSPPGA